MTKITGDIDTTPTNYTVVDSTQIASHLKGIDTALKDIKGRVGSIVYWPAEEADIPANTLICDGSFVLQDTYPELYDAIGIIYGNAGSWFSLPNYNGWFLRGAGGGTDPNSASRLNRGDGHTGNVVGTYQTFQTNSHAHGMNRTTNTSTGGGGGRVTGTGTSVYTNNHGTNEARPTNRTVVMLIVYKATP